MLIEALLFVLGLGLLVAGAEVLVRGASRLAALAGISPLVVGLTVVAFGTSAPEMAVTVQAALTGQAGADLALGNVIGSNIFNVLFILGVSAVAAPLVVSVQLVRLDVPLMIGVSALAFGLALDGRIGRLEGALLVGGLLAYVAFTVAQARRSTPPAEPSHPAVAAGGAGTPRHAGRPAMLAQSALLVLAGLVLLVVGSRWLVAGSLAFARALGVSELVVGLTIVAAGTSLPEVATSVVATIRGERDIAVGNVVGSNIFNLLGVLGLAALVAPGGVTVAPSALTFDLPVMLATAAACLPIFFTGYTIARWEGLLFLGCYAAYTAFLILAATEHDALEPFSTIMLLFVLPLTAVTLAVLALRERRRKGAQGCSGVP